MSARSIRRFYIPFAIEAKVNYLYIFNLMLHANYNKLTNTYDYLQPGSIRMLSELVGISKSTLNRILNDTEYRRFFSYDSTQCKITFNNQFFGDKGKVQPFVIIEKREIDFLKQYNENLLCKYFIYIKYYCSISINNMTDFTTNQFLNAVQYSTRSASQRYKISTYNNIFKETSIIKVNSYYDSKGKKRNIYSYNGL